MSIRGSIAKKAARAVKSELIGQAAIEAEFFGELATVHRTFGQYKRTLSFSGTFEEFTGYHVPKRITAGSVKTLRRYARKATIEYEKESRREDVKKGKMLVENLKRELAIGLSYVTGNQTYMEMQAKSKDVNFAARGAERLNRAISRVINKAIISVGYAEIGELLDKFLREYGRDLQRYAYSVIDTGSGGFNTNSRWNQRDARGEVGRARFRNFTEALCDALGMPFEAASILSVVDV